jgi:2-pyrone-4,6-dicarboxylate lactonase
MAERQREINPPNPNPRKPTLKAPPKSVDCHLHLYGPFDRFPINASKAERSYMPTDTCALEHYLKMQATLGLERAVVVTGNPNGRHNNEVTLDAIKRMGGKFKGLAHLDSLIDQKELERLADGGFTGFRIRQARTGSEFFRDAERSCDRSRDFGWHVEVHTFSIDEVVELLPWLPKLKMPYSLDHVAHAEPGHEKGDKRFRRVLDSLKNEENCWVNLYSFYLQSKTGAPQYADMVPVVHKLIETRLDRLIWGSNWPHAIHPHEPTPDDGDLLDFLLAAAPDPAHRQAILVDNPARLYGWKD